MNTFQLIVAIAFGIFFGRSLEYIFASIVEIANRRNREEYEAQRMEEVREKAKELSDDIRAAINELKARPEIEKANPNLEVEPMKNNKGVKVNAKTSNRKRV